MDTTQVAKRKITRRGGPTGRGKWTEPQRGAVAPQRTAPGETWQSFIEKLSEQAGSDMAVARRIGFTDGSRVSEWRRGTDRLPSAVTCARIAAIFNFHPLDVMELGGHVELVGLIRGRLTEEDEARGSERDERYADALRRVQEIINTTYQRTVTGARQ